LTDFPPFERLAADGSRGGSTVDDFACVNNKEGEEGEERGRRGVSA